MPAKRHMTTAMLATALLSAAALGAPRPTASAPGVGADRSTGWDSDGVQLHAHVSVGSFGTGAGNGNDCWGYTSPSGREYALMGLENAMAVVEITNPASPSIIETISHTNSLWADLKVYQDVVYVSNESGGGVDVVDLAQVDDGVVTLVQRMTDGGLSSVHNIAIDTESGFLYLCIGNINGGRLVAYDLSNPRYPTLAGSMTSGNGGVGQHDAQVVTYTSGPWSGRQICFGAAQGQGLDIIDVTDKSNMVLMSRTSYPSLSYAHQCWLGEDRQYLYLNDETDGVAETRVFDVSDLENPVLEGTFGWGSNSIDHNLYVKGNRIYQANYTSGFRVLDLGADPVSPPLIAYFDTYPANDGQSYNGLWSCYPFFPSGIVIGSDLESGLFVWSVVQPELEMEVLDPLPERIDPTGDSLSVRLSAVNDGEVDPDAAFLHVNDGSGWSEQVFEVVPGGFDEYDAIFPPTECGSQVGYYLSATSVSGYELVLPAGGAASPWVVLSAVDVVIDFEDSFETNTGWSVSGNASDGQWERGIPAGGGDRGDPASAAHGAYCYLTDNEDGNSDVDGGATILTSPILDGSGEGAALSYWRWFNNSFGASPYEDIMTIEISYDGGSTWSIVEIVGPTDQASGGWYEVQFALSDIAGYDQSANTRLRVTAEDTGDGSVVESALDGLRISTVVCDAPCPEDVNGDAMVNVSDLLAVIAAWGGSGSGDVDGDGLVGVSDILTIIAAWGPC